MYYVEIMQDGRNRASFPCKTLPEAKRTAVAVQELVVTSDERIRIVKEIDFDDVPHCRSGH